MFEELLRTFAIDQPVPELIVTSPADLRDAMRAQIELGDELARIDWQMNEYYTFRVYQFRSGAVIRHLWPSGALH